ncbi:organic solute transporter ostalpha protein (DUF300) [Rhynchospora pubera]|uniref:Organic solute transporter ostalpha protein (DUF300) n=1 Tax=Rhynchospora pubera TaxID=906938 RepID=A0AAV8HAE3_9POAL|nr:organic solute transporter ostalpha protein (DUF300) [Rhynchospora pubera]
MKMLELGFLYQYLSSYATPVWATVIAGFFVAVSLCLSTYLIIEHLSAYNNPEEQKFLLGVILMVPCYAIESFISLVNPSASVDCGILREGYEAFAMYCFGRYLTACLGGEEQTIEFLKREGAYADRAPLLESSEHQRGIIHHHFPVNYMLKPWKLGEWFYLQIKIGIYQYVIIKTLTATSSVILEAFDSYCDGQFRWNCGYPYMTVILNFSQYWALYCLVHFYTATKEELAQIKPLYKFLMFKSIVFLTWWQGVIIAIMYSLGLLRSPIAQEFETKTTIQDFIICIEMGLASVAHLYVFPAKPYEQITNLKLKNVAVLGDYASVDCPVDPEEVRDSTRPSKPKHPQSELEERYATSIKSSIWDFLFGGGQYVIKDLKFTVNHAVEPMEKGIYKFNEKIVRWRGSKDDSDMPPAPPEREPIRGIDDPLLGGSTSDSGVPRGKRHRRVASSTVPNQSASAESQVEWSEDGFQIQGSRWTTRRR